MELKERREIMGNGAHLSIKLARLYMVYFKVKILSGYAYELIVMSE